MNNNIENTKGNENLLRRQLFLYVKLFHIGNIKTFCSIDIKVQNSSLENTKITSNFTLTLLAMGGGYYSPDVRYMHFWPSSKCLMSMWLLEFSYIGNMKHFNYRAKTSMRGRVSGGPPQKKLMGTKKNIFLKKHFFKYFYITLLLYSQKLDVFKKPELKILKNGGVIPILDFF